MNLKISLFYLSFCFAVAISMSVPASIDQQWEDYKKKFNKTYRNSEVEIGYKENFIKNVERINHHNEQYEMRNVSYKLGINQLVDLSDTQISEFKLPNRLRVTESEYWYKPNHDATTKVPNVFDWRSNGIPSVVKDKGNCMSDYAFAAIGMLEGYVFKKTGKYIQLSTQDLIDCSTSKGNAGCRGGFVKNTFLYVQEQRGISTEELYPLSIERELMECRENITRDGISRNYLKFDCTDVLPRGDEQEMKYVVSHYGPIAAKISAPTNFFFYKEGIFTGEDCRTDIVDYNVLIVGYNKTQAGEEYWTVKNWMGPDWGEQGYARIARNKNNTCGIASRAWKLEQWVYEK